MKMGAPSRLGFQLGLTFFGFNDDYRADLHDLIFDMIWFGEGRWDWNTIYNMPIFLRNFWIRKMNDIADTRKKQNQQRTQQKSSK